MPLSDVSDAGNSVEKAAEMATGATGRTKPGAASERSPTKPVETFAIPSSAATDGITYASLYPRGNRLRRY